jgi:hypothetical protein
VAEASSLSSSENQRQDAFATPRFTPTQIHWLDVIKNYIALNGAFATDDQDAYLDAWQSVDSGEGFPLAVACKAFGGDPKDIIEELNSTPSSSHELFQETLRFRKKSRSLRTHFTSTSKATCEVCRLFSVGRRAYQGVRQVWQGNPHLAA